MEKRQCKICLETKPLTKKYFPSKQKEKYFEYKCCDCKNIKLKLWRENNKEHCIKYNKDNWKNNKEKLAARSKNYKTKNKEKYSNKRKEFYKNNKDRLINYSREWYFNCDRDQFKIRRRENNLKYKIRLNKWRRSNYLENKQIPSFKIRMNISSSIRSYFRKNNLNKVGKSTFKHLPYTPKQFKEHIESLFEPWMNWNNWGVYKVSEWNDNDQSTWKWNLDHIIPHCNFTYTSMEDQAFKDCWSLSNLRPLNAKQNVIDGARIIIGDIDK